MLKRLTTEQRQSLELAVNHYAAQAGGASQYLAARGISPDLAAMHRLGYVGDPLPGDEKMLGRLTIPYLSPAGPTDIRFRAIAEGAEPKYLGRPGVETGVYNVAALWRESAWIAVCEGEIDTITMDQILPTIGLPGANSWKSFHARLLGDYERVLVMCDGDEAGHGFGQTVMRAVDEAKAIHLPDGHDVNSLFQAAGLDALRRLIGVPA